MRVCSLCLAFPAAPGGCSGGDAQADVTANPLVFGVYRIDSPAPRVSRGGSVGGGGRGRGAGTILLDCEPEQPGKREGSPDVIARRAARAVGGNELGEHDRRCAAENAEPE